MVPKELVHPSNKGCKQTEVECAKWMGTLVVREKVACALWSVLR